MQIVINKKGRVVKLTKTERTLLANAKTLCAELCSVTKHEAGEAFARAEDAIGEGLASLDTLPLIAAGATT